jgi:ABC-type polysaccharide/polyol phosphate export permease
LGFLIAYGKLAPTALLLPLPLLVQLVFTLGLALFVSALTVHFRDVQSLLGHLVHLWFFASPVLYLYGVQEGWLRFFLRLNPMAHVLVSYQEMLFDGRFDHGPQLATTALVALVVFAFGAWFFDRLRDTLAEEV